MSFKRWKAQSFPDKLFDILNYTILTIAAIVCLYPLYYIVIVSFSREVYGAWLLPNGFSLEGYKLVFQDGEIWRAYINTIFYTLGGVVMGLFLTIPYAYAISRKDLPGRSLFTGYLLVTMFLSGGLIPGYLTVQSLGLVDTWWVVIILTGVSAYNVIVARTFFATSIPDELLEASRMDGCGNGRFFFKIVLPLSKPILAVIALWIGVGRWNSYFTEMVYLRDKVKYPLAMFLRRLLWQMDAINAMITGTVGDTNAEITESMLEQLRVASIMQYVVIVCASLPMLVIYPFIQKYFAKGVMVGSVKG